MKKMFTGAIGLASLVAAISAVPTVAQSTTGTINVTGQVGARCSVIETGGAGQAFTRSIGLKQLDNDNGVLRADLVSSTSASPAEGVKVNARVNCNTANPRIGVVATKLTTGASDPGADYSNTINYSASLKVKTQSAKTVEAIYATVSDTSAVTRSLGERIAGGNDNNVEVSVFGLATDKALAQLAQGVYNSLVTVTIEPTF